MAAPTTEELKLIKEFRKLNAGVPLVEAYTDMECVAWLRARDLNLTKANEMFKKHLVWRQEIEYNEIKVWEPPRLVTDEFPYEIIGEDAEGRAVLLLPLGEWDIRKVVTAGKGKEVVKYVAQAFENVNTKTRESSEALGREVAQFSFIFDAANFSMRQLTSMSTVNVMLQVVHMFEANYPEKLFTCVIVNASRIFYTLFSIVKPLLSARTLGKIQIYTTPDKWQPILLEKFPLSILPVEYGGIRTGRRISVGALPYRDRSLTENLSTSHISVLVGAGKQFELALTVEKPGSRIIWTFETESYDIGFSINFNRTEEVVGSRRCNSHLNEEAGNVICQKPGDYFLIFDNTYSKLRGKMIHYFVDVLLPEEDYLQDVAKPTT